MKLRDSNLNKDLFEQKNLANNPEHAPQLKAMQAELGKVIDRLPHTFCNFKKAILSIKWTEPLAPQQ